MMALSSAQQFLAEYKNRRVVLVPHPDCDGLAGAALLWRAVGEGSDRWQALCPAKGETLYSDSFRATLHAAQPDALVVIDQGSDSDPLLRGVPTLTIDHHLPEGIPSGVFVNSYVIGEHAENAACLCHQIAGKPADLGWLAAIGALADHGALAKCKSEDAGFMPLDLQEVASLVSAARRGSGFHWREAFTILAEASGPKQIAEGTLPQVAMLRADREEVKREFHHAKRAHPLLADPWAIISFASPCLVHGMLATSWVHRLGAHYVLAANFGYQPGYVHFSMRTEFETDLIAALSDIAPSRLLSEWRPGHHGTRGAIAQSDFALLLTYMGFTPQQVVEMKHAVRAHRVAAI